MDTANHYQNQRTRSAISSGFFDILNDLKWYEARSGAIRGPGYRTALLTLVDLMTPIIPHFAEEINEKVRKAKTFACHRPFPKPNKRLINKKLEEEERLIRNVRDDIEGIFNAIKKRQKKALEKIEIFIAPKWMYKVLSIRRQKPDNLIAKIMQEETIRKAGNAAAKYAQKLMKNPGYDSTLSQRAELAAITDALEYYKREFKAKEVVVMLASKSDHAKARAAEPGRPGIALTFM